MVARNVRAVTGIIAIVMAAAGARAAQDPPVSAAQRFFEAGQHDQALAAVAEARSAGGAGPQDAFIAAQVLLKQGQNDRAREELARLTASGDPAIRLAGESSLAAIENNLDRAVDLATQAVNAAGSAPADSAGRLRSFQAYYQLGLVRSQRNDWAGAAEAFERASELNPTFAYAHYYAGLASSRIQRPDRVAVHFERFLQLAPNAPERSAVTSILRTLRGV
jgi:tetratricopeptide (TPR) repeat protein